MEKSSAECEVAADANFIGWGRWAAKELLYALAPKAGMNERRPPYQPNIDAAPAAQAEKPAEYRP